MTIIGAEQQSTGSYVFYYRTKDGWKDYFVVYEGYKVRDAAIMFIPSMTRDVFDSLPDRIERE